MLRPYSRGMKNCKNSRHEGTPLRLKMSKNKYIGTFFRIVKLFDIFEYTTESSAEKDTCGQGLIRVATLLRLHIIGSSPCMPPCPSQARQYASRSQELSQCHHKDQASGKGVIKACGDRVPIPMDYNSRAPNPAGIRHEPTFKGYR